LIAHRPGQESHCCLLVPMRSEQEIDGRGGFTVAPGFQTNGVPSDPRSGRLKPSCYR
jgi:hypothetical protein